MSLKIRIKNAKEVQAALEKYGSAVEKGVGSLVKMAGVKAMADVKKRIYGPPKTGNIYKRGEKTHQASAEGEAPANDTGTLANSIYFTFFSRNGSAVYAKVQSRLPYAYYLEYGTMANMEYGTVRMWPRPAWEPAMKLAGKELNEDIDLFLKALNK